MLEIMYKEKGLFWLTVLEVTVHYWLAPLLWSYDKAAHCRGHMAEKNCSPNSQKTKEVEETVAPPSPSEAYPQ
jgi:hypothetical protein